MDQITGEKKVTITVPAAIYGFFKDLLAFDGGDRTPEEVFREEIIGLVDSVFDVLPGDWFNRKSLMEAYNLREYVSPLIVARNGKNEA